jgi:hypothetical protein
LLGPATWTYASSSLAFVLARCGAEDEALRLIHTMDADTPGIRANFIGPLLLLGESEQAMQRAWDAAREGCGPLPVLLHAPENRALRQHADFERLAGMIPGWAGSW